MSIEPAEIYKKTCQNLSLCTKQKALPNEQEGFT